ncbi:MAG TPA: NAD-dependent epimerase/dehydratase family protein [archaeon]|nr:NAD-dependent epimerase/dehydratase family protein [archaeon]
MKILITGACGFIGSNLCESLLKDGHEVVGVDDFSGMYDKKYYDSNIALLKKYSSWDFVKGNILDKKIFEKLMNKKITHIVHLAAKTGVRDSVKHPKEYLRVNIEGSSNVLEFAKDKNIKHVILASTSSVYGKNKTPFNESMQTNTPLSPYAASKIGMEALAHSYHAIYNMPIVVLRFFTVYGPRGRRDMAIYKFIKMISEGGKIEIFGQGDAERDFTYVEDTVSGIVRALGLEGGFNIINLGCQKTVPLMRVVNLIEKNLGKKAKIKFLAKNPEDMHITCADISRAADLLGYSPKTTIERGIEKSVQSYQKEKRGL